MRVGIQVGFGESHSRQFIMDTFGMIEELGFDSVWMGEHVLLFPEYDSPYPYSPTGKMASTTKGTMDTFTSLSFAAAVTDKIKLGTAVTLVTQRNPIYMAKQAADIDILSDGRLLLGAGVGWQREEYEALGEDWSTRGKRLTESAELMKHLWSDQELSNYQGEFYSVRDAWMYPKPVQRDRLPLIFGGEKNPALRRVATHGDGWMAAAISQEIVETNLQNLNGFLEAENRSLNDIGLYLIGAFTPESVKTYEAMGFQEVITALFMSGVSSETDLRERLLPMRELVE